jgi:hypothetical protein
MKGSELALQQKLRLTMLFPFEYVTNYERLVSLAAEDSSLVNPHCLDLQAPVSLEKGCPGTGHVALENPPIPPAGSTGPCETFAHGDLFLRNRTVATMQAAANAKDPASKIAGRYACIQLPLPRLPRAGSWRWGHFDDECQPEMTTEARKR